MKDAKSVFIAAVLDLVLLAALAFICACEVSSATQKIEIRPDGATLRYGESVTFTAYNGYIYTWTLQNDTWGLLSSRSGMTVTYKSIYDPTAPAIQVITVSSTFSDNNTGGSTGTVTQTAQAYITHIPATSDIVAAVSAP